jgi:lactoylglutathione lyase
MINDLTSVAVVISDAKKSTEWYTKVLGFKVVSNDDHWVTVAPQNSNTTIHLCQGPDLEPGNTGILLKTQNVDETYSELSKKGVQFTKPPRDDGWGKYAMFKDPDGNEFWLMT